MTRDERRMTRDERRGMNSSQTPEGEYMEEGGVGAVGGTNDE